MAEGQAQTTWRLDPDRNVWAIFGDERFRDVMYRSLQAGERRFGWSYVETADPESLAGRIEREGWSSLSEKEKDCYQRFLLEIRPGERVVYVNVPARGEGTLARADRPHFFRWDPEIGDLGHRFGVDPTTLRTFDRNAAFVHPRLSSLLKFRGRYRRIHARDEFQDLLDSLAEPGAVSSEQKRTPVDHVKQLFQELNEPLKKVLEGVRRTHPNRDLEMLMQRVFEAMPGVIGVERKAGSGDRGADLVVIDRAGLPVGELERDEISLVQVKAYEGLHDDTRAVEDIRRAFEHHPEATVGLIVSTAEGVSQRFHDALRKLGEGTDKTVAMLYGANLARLVLRHPVADRSEGAAAEG